MVDRENRSFEQSTDNVMTKVPPEAKYAIENLQAGLRGFGDSTVASVLTGDYFRPGVAGYVVAYANQSAAEKIFEIEDDEASAHDFLRTLDNLKSAEEVLQEGEEVTLVHEVENHFGDPVNVLRVGLLALSGEHPIYRTGIN
jgi:hypothetical protein